MWEEERKKRLILNIVIFLLLLCVAAGLFTGIRAAKKKIAAEDAFLKGERENQLQQMNDTRQDNLEAVQKAYEQDLQAIAEYIPGIVCWGDSLTAGSSGNISYPRTLQKYLNTYLCDIYDLRYSVEDAEGVTRVNWEDYKVSIPVVNMGAGREDSATILGRAGVAPYEVGRDFVIPADTQSVEISLLSPSGKAVKPLTAGNVGINPVTIDGVEGTLSKVSDAKRNAKSSYVFTRTEAGSEVNVTKGTQIIPACVDQYKDYLHIIWLGNYDETFNPENLVKDVKALLARQNVNPDRYLVIGPCATRGSWRNSVAVNLDAIDTAMLQAFGDHYINLRKYLIEDGVRDLNGGSSTKSYAGLVPDIFRGEASSADLNASAYQLTGKLVFERMDLLGYFDEIRQELKLDEITQNILKNDPDYFNRQLTINK